MRFILACLLAVASGAAAQELVFKVQLRSPLSTEKNHKGDAVMAIVVSPDAFKNDLMEGKVTEVKSGSKLRGQSVLNFTFETIRCRYRPASPRWPIQRATRTWTRKAG